MPINKVIIYYPDPEGDRENYSWVENDEATPVGLTDNINNAKQYPAAEVDAVVSALNIANPGLNLYSGNPTTPPPKPF
jgi:hypothetical protein